MREGWEEVDFLNSIEKTINTNKVSKKSFLVEGTYPIISQEKNLINGYWNNSNDVFEVSKAVILFGDHTKIIKYIDFDFVLGADGVKILLPKKNLESKFFYYQLKSFSIQNLGYARHYRLLKEFKIVIPPLPEQKQIVKTLDLAFKQIDQAKANIEKNIANAKELFASKLNEVFSQRGEGWEEKKLEELSPHKNAIVSGPFGSNLKVSDYRDSGVPIIRLQNVGKGRFIEKDIKYIEEEKAEELKSHSFVTGDIVLAKLGIPIGKTCIIPESFSDGIILADIVRIRPDRRIVNYNFLEYFLNTSLSVSQLTKNISGATRPRVNLSNVRSIIVPLPPIIVQNDIVIKITKLENNIITLETAYQQNLNNLEELKKSILEKAFKGEL